MVESSRGMAAEPYQRACAVPPVTPRGRGTAVLRAAAGPAGRAPRVVTGIGAGAGGPWARSRATWFDDQGRRHALGGKFEAVAGPDRDRAAAGADRLALGARLADARAHAALVLDGRAAREVVVQVGGAPKRLELPGGAAVPAHDRVGAASQGIQFTAADALHHGGRLDQPPAVLLRR